MLRYVTTEPLCMRPGLTLRNFWSPYVNSKRKFDSVMAFMLQRSTPRYTEEDSEPHEWNVFKAVKD